MSDLLNYLKSEEGKIASEEYFYKLLNKKVIQNIQLDRFHEKYKDRFEEIVIKIEDYYSSNKYRMKWYKIGIEPPEGLISFLFEYATKYGRECSEQEIIHYGNTFTAAMYIVHGFIFNLMQGQGSVIQIYKL